MENSTIPTPSGTVEEIFTAFVRERRYTKGVSVQTEQWYHQSFAVFREVWERCNTVGELSKETFAPAVEGMIRRGVRAVTVNSYCRVINAFLRWLHTEGKVPHLTVIPKLKEPHRVVNVFGQDEIQKLFAHRPKGPIERRVQTLALLIADTGMRLNEALTLRRPDIEFDDLLITIRQGKGGRQRKIPFSTAMRKVLWKYIESMGGSPERLVFSTRDGSTVLLQNNVRRDFAALCRRLRIGAGVKGGFHVLRHGFATEYLRRGGDLIRLGRVLGHSNLEITRRYVHFNVEDLSAVHESLSQVGKAGER